MSRDIPRPTKTADAIDAWYRTVDELLATIDAEAEAEAMSHLTGDDCLRTFGVGW